MASVQINFLNYIIRFNEVDEQWEAYVEDSSSIVTQSKSLKALKDKLTKESKIKYPRVGVIVRDYGQRWKMGDITSIAETNRYSGGKEFWVTDSKKTRSKERENSLYALNKNNIAILERVKDLKAAASKLYEDASRLEDTMEKFDVAGYISLVEDNK